MAKSMVERARELRPIIEAAAQAGLDDDTAITAVELFPAWAIGVAYAVGARINYGGLLYKCAQAHTSQADWTPDATPALWVRVDDPGEDWPDWRQPAGAHDAYEKGYKVSHNEKHWISDVDGNVWEPGVYGWTQAE